MRKIWFLIPDKNPSTLFALGDVNMHKLICEKMMDAE